LVQRLLQRKPTALEDDDEWYLFNDAGVKEYTKNPYSVIPQLGREVWVLVDSNENVHKPSGIFTSKKCKAFIIQATSPRESRYYQWQKHRGAPIWTMDVWSRDELEFAMQVNFKLVWTVLINCHSEHLWTYTDDQKKTLRRSFEFFGPSPRVARRCVQPNGFQQRMMGIIASLPRDIAAFTGGLNEAPISYHVSSHRWCLVVPGENRFPKATFVSPWVMKLIMERQADATAEFLHAMYKATTAMPSMGTMAGKMFEAIAHPMLWNGRHTATGLGPTNTSFQVEFTEADKNWMSFAQLQEFEDVGRRADGTWPPIYAQPTSQNFPTIDSFAIICGRLHLFQITVDYKHTINLKGLADICAELPLAMRPTKEKPLCFVWVIPFDTSRTFGLRGYSKCTAKEKQHWDPLIQQYVIQLRMGRQDFISKLRLHSCRILLKLC
jgi:hypothetical protein